MEGAVGVGAYDYSEREVWPSTDARGRDLSARNALSRNLVVELRRVRLVIFSQDSYTTSSRLLLAGQFNTIYFPQSALWVHLNENSVIVLFQCTFK